MKKQHVSRITVALISAALVALTVPGLAGADTIKVGAILILSGNSATTGQSVRDGLQLAVDEVNQRGGVNGSRIELIIEDGKSDAKAAVDAFNRIETSRAPLFYVSLSSTMCLAVAPLADEKHVVLFGISTATRDVTRGREWVYRYWPLGQTYIPTLMRTLQDLKAKKIGMLYQNDEFGKEQQQLLSKEFESAGGSVSSELIEMTDTDFRSKITLLKDREAIYVACTGNILLGMLRQLKEAGYRGQILAAGFAYQASLFSLPEAEGIYLTAPIIYNPNYLYAKDLTNKFSNRYKKALDASAAVGYDLLKLITSLLEEQQVSRQGLKDLLEAGFDYPGVFGQLKLKSGEHDLAIPVYPAQVVKGTLKYR